MKRRELNLAAIAWYRERSPKAARSFEVEVRQAVEQIREFPESWSVYMKGCWRFLLHQFPFQVVYQGSGQKILILAIAHTHRKPSYWMVRL